MKNIISLLLVSFLLLCPALLFAQTVEGEVKTMHSVLAKLMDDMMPLCSKITTIARGIAGFGAILYIVVRAGRNIAAAEPIDFFPLLRPFVLAVLIGMYPTVLSVINGILKPTVEATNTLADKENKAVIDLLYLEYELKSTGKAQFPAGQMSSDEAKEWYQYAHPEQAGNDEQSMGFWSLVWGKIEGTITYWIKLALSQILQILFFAAALCLDAMRTFHLVILAILGPYVFALSVYDGFQHTLSIWLARYINIYMWLPVANLFSAMISKIQGNMIKADIDRMLAGNYQTSFDYTDMSYLIFLIVGIIGYFSVPSIANYIVHASGGNALMSKVTGMAKSAVTMTATGGASGSGGASGASGTNAGSMAGDKPYNDKLSYSYADAANSENYLPDGGYQQKRIGG
ncbi:conjugative transposon TraJ protein [Chitinophaga niastensis]|uniref:Conjugative transposon TraJ protein n=1 Tax=Chitinophaga niastensis TaxID=536980 RepID=A0A2P8H9H4_CHINA|nr:conjugative transposon protein TraJ [Chitinophaga niastensis]PSL42819.1 conjugative transposon TraJ protein [Chitinophaga niastensis]